MDAITMIVLCMGICVALPVLVVWIIGRVRQNDTNRRAEVMLKAIENGQSIDPELFATPRKKQTIKQDLLDKFSGACITTLMGTAFLVAGLLYVSHPAWRAFLTPSMMIIAGVIMLAVGIGLFVSFYYGKKMLAREIEAEERKLTEESK
jgi:hypothetical protein